MKGGYVPTLNDYRVLEHTDGSYAVQKRFQVRRWFKRVEIWENIDRDGSRIVSFGIGGPPALPPGRYATLEGARQAIARFARGGVVHAPRPDAPIELHVTTLDPDPLSRIFASGLARIEDAKIMAGIPVEKPKTRDDELQRLFVSIGELLNLFEQYHFDPEDAPAVTERRIKGTIRTLRKQVGAFPSTPACPETKKARKR